MPKITPLPNHLLATFPGNDPAILRFRKEIVVAFPDAGSAQDLLVEAGLDIHSVFWGQSARAFWREIIDDAKSRGNLRGLIELAIRKADETETELHGTCRCIDVLTILK